MPFVYDSNNPATHSFVDVFVNNDDVGLLIVSGLGDGEELPVLVGVGPKPLDIWAPLAMNGVFAALRPDNTQMLLDPRGWYRLDIPAGGFAGRVVVHFESLELEHISRTPHPFTVADPEFGCAPLADRGLRPDW